MARREGAGAGKGERSGAEPGLDPHPETLARAPLHLVVRDFPETLAVVRERGVSPERGGEPGALVEGECPGLVEALVRVTAWRRETEA